MTAVTFLIIFSWGMAQVIHGVVWCLMIFVYGALVEILRSIPERFTSNDGKRLREIDIKGSRSCAEPTGESISSSGSCGIVSQQAHFELSVFVASVQRHSTETLVDVFSSHGYTCLLLIGIKLTSHLVLNKLIHDSRLEGVTYHRSHQSNDVLYHHSYCPKFLSNGHQSSFYLENGKREILEAKCSENIDGSHGLLKRLIGLCISSCSKCAVP